MSCKWYDYSCGLEWIRDELQAFAVWIVHNILSAVNYLIDLIPVPGFMQNITTYSITGDIAYFVAPFQIDVGIAIIVTAYTGRFVIRRLPVVG